MKKQISFFLFGILLSILLLEGTTRLISPLLGPPLLKWNTMEDAKILKFEEYLDQFERPQYVLMGNSTTLIGFDPTVFDNSLDLPLGSSFNAAMNGSDMERIRDFACSYIIKNVNPKNLVILFSYATMAQDLNYENKCSGGLSGNSILERNSYLLRYKNTFRDPMTVNTLIRILRFRDTRQGIVYRWADNLDGFGYTKYGTSTHTVDDPGWQPSTAPEDSRAIPIELASLRYLIEIRDMAKSMNVNLIIGTVPTLSYDPDYRSSIEEVAKKLGVKFIQGNNALGEGKFFQDGVHLNRLGSIEFSRFLARELPKLNSG
jgi:hypothetical protein